MARKRLTLKQERFVQEYIKDGNATRAVQVAYPNIKTYGGQRAMGSILLTKDNIHERLLEALNNGNVTPEYVIKGLKEIAETGSKSEKSRALRTIAEIMGLVGRNPVIATQVNVAQQITDNERAILARYGLLLEGEKGND
jgi:phage terminase small subunit